MTQGNGIETECTLGKTDTVPETLESSLGKTVMVPETLGSYLGKAVMVPETLERSGNCGYKYVPYFS